jgi:hypothetical protein
VKENPGKQNEETAPTNASVKVFYRFARFRKFSATLETREILLFWRVN